MTLANESALACAAGSAPHPRPVRVSWFDPRTGEPCDEKPEPLHARTQPARSRAQDGYRTSLERGRKRRPVLVDGVRHESIAAAARAIGCDKTTFGNALRAGKAEFRGRAVAFADEGRKG